jgi:iron complex outermembrane receptor protein
VGSTYLELQSDVTNRLLIDVAGRYSHDSDYGSSTTGKFAVRYKFTDDLLLRSSLSNSFRAPALAQTGFRLATLNFNDEGTGLQNNAWLPPTDPLAQLLGGQPLGPERSVNISAGLAWRSQSRAFASLDLYQIKITDRITPTEQISTEGQEAYLIEHGLTDIASVQYLTNTLDTRTRGLDAVIGKELDVWGGTLKLSGAFNRNYLQQQGLRNPDLVSGQVLVPLEYGSPSTKLILSTDWGNSTWGGFVQATRFGTVYAYSFDEGLPTINGWNVQRYDPIWSVDLEARVQVIKQVQFALGGTNVFNHYPAQTTPDGSYGGAFPYNYAHPLGINGAYFYAKLTLTTGH